MSKFIIEGGHPLSGSVRPSGNKNEALPALLACLLTEETITLERVPKIQDVLTMVEILEGLGVEANWENEETLLLNASNVHSFQPSLELCAKVRASILFLGPLLARFGKVELAPPGGDVIGARRIDPHFDGLTAIGAQLTFGPPITGKIDKIQGNEVFLDEPSVTATENLLLLAVLCEGTTSIYNAACEPHVVGLCNLLNSMGAKISGIGSNHLTIQGVSSLHGATHKIGPDFMEVGSFLCLGAIAGGKVTVEDVEIKDLRYALKTLTRIGVLPEIGKNSLTIDGTKPLKMQTDIGDRISSIWSGPWPAYPSDLMSVSIVAATQAHGTIIFHEKMFEGRLFFTDKLMSMGANIVLCDPHRVVITGPAALSATHMSSPDVRAGMAMLMAAAIAKGTSTIGNIYQIERGYFNIEGKLRQLGAKIKRVSAED